MVTGLPKRAFSIMAVISVPQPGHFINNIVAGRLDQSGRKFREMLASLQSDRDRHRCAVASDKLLFGEVDSGHNERDARRRSARHPRMGEDAGGICRLGQCPHLRTGVVMRIDRKMVFCAFLSLLAVPSGLLAQAQTEAPAKPAADCAELAETKARLEAQEKRLKDWPDLARYREANARVTAPVKDEQRVVFMGDSITDMWALPRFGGFFPGKPYIDRGISGQTTPQMLVRFRSDVIALQPKVVVILAGTNDIAGNTGPITLEETEGNLASMAELARANGIRVVLSSVLPVSNYGHDREGHPIDNAHQAPTGEDSRIEHLDQKVRCGQRSCISRLFFHHGGRRRAAQKGNQRGWPSSQRCRIR